jgi:outer membrane protein
VARSFVCMLVLVSMLGITATQAVAKDLKVGIVNVELVIARSKKGKAAQKKLKSYLKKKESALKQQQETIQGLEKKLTNQGGMMTDEARKKAYSEYQQKAAKFQEDYMQSRQDIAKKEAALTQPILERLQKVLEGLFNLEGYDIILNQTSQGVLFAKEKFNLNELVLKKLDQ